MNREMIGVIVQVVLMVALSYPLGKYIAKVYKGEKTLLDFLKPIERLFFRFSGIDPDEEMSWKKFLKLMLILNGVWFFWGIILLVAQGKLPFNPDGNAGQNFHQAFNTSISFLVNCDLQHYSGESNLTYFTQLFVILLFNFVAPATGMAALAGVMKAFASKTTKTIGNFWRYFVLSFTRILLPLALLVGFFMITQGVPMTFNGKMTVPTLEGGKQMVSQGPVAAITSIAELGTNGGGFFGANVAHPLANPTYLSNAVECIALILIPMAMVLAFGFFINRKKLGYSIFGVMFFAFVVGACINVHEETHGNPRIEQMCIAQHHGSMEGKEVRFGAAATGLWTATTTCTSNGSVDGMHDSTMPLSGLVEMLNMQISCWFSGVGAGWLNYFIFIVIAVFISGLMVGRTPEFLGKKVEAREMKIACISALTGPLIILAGTALAAFMFVHCQSYVAHEGGWLNNPGFHGLSEMFYEFSSSSATNGSGFEGLGDNTLFWDVSCGIVLLLGRFLPLICPVAIAGLLAEKKFIPESAGTLKTDTLTFAGMTFAVIIIVAALSFFPALSLSTIAEQLSL